MIRTYSEIISGGPWGAETFHGFVEDSPNEAWQSRLPDLESFVANIQADPAAAFTGLDGALVIDQLERYHRVGSDAAFDTAWMQVSNLGLSNVVSATRNVVGLLVRSCGVLSSAFPKLRGMFKQETTVALQVANLLDSLVSTSAFTIAINAIGAIPVVGWIVRAVIAIAQIVVRIVQTVRAKKHKEAYRSIAKQLVVPAGAVELESNVDQQEMRDFFSLLLFGKNTYNPQALIRPAYDGDLEKFEAFGVHAKETKKKRSDVELAAGWVVAPGVPTGGFGFVPGSGNLSRSLFFPAGVSGGNCAAGSLRDLGGLYPTAQGAANTWWSLVLQEGPTMFQVEPLRERTAWQNLIEGMLWLVKDTLQGWTCAPSGIKFSHFLECVPEMYGVGPCGKAGRKTGMQPIPSEFGLDPHTTTAGYIYQLFFGLKKLTDRFKLYDPDIGVGLPLINDETYISDQYGDNVIRWPTVDAFDLDESVPVRALNNLYDRQMYTLRSINCMYVDGEPENRDRFPAFNNKALRDQWYESVTAIINGPDWRRVRPVDVPASRMKEHLLQRIRNAGLNPETFNPPCPPGAPPSHPGCQMRELALGPTVLGDIPPPPPPPPTDAEPGPARPVPTPMVARPVGGRRKKAGGAGALIAIGAVAAFLATRK